MKTETINVYEYSELSPEVQEKARNWYRSVAFDYEWWDSVVDDTKTIGALMGIDIDAVYFSGFWSQGDGACFVGDYQYKQGSVKSIKDYAPLDKELHQIVKALFDIQRKHFYQISAKVTHIGRYSHEYTTNIEVSDSRNNYGWVNNGDNVESDLAEVLRDFMRWIYRQLENEYEWLISDEQVEESIIANGYGFTVEGELC